MQNLTRWVAQAKQRVPGLRVTHRFDLIIGGVSVVAPVGEIDKLRRLPNVVEIINDRIDQIETYRTPAFIGATTAWGKGGGSAFAGEGVIFGVLDSGVWPEHPSFSDPDPLGKPYAPAAARTRQSRRCSCLQFRQCDAW
jgi:hypothetical protein